ncbi:hypothetical protein C7B69_07525 [filamentous cyanobacterium Phorm 46]|nr:hypothetical protein C7B69_07525 [filamentous cyanobacterium Phorm 46]
MNCPYSKFRRQIILQISNAKFFKYSIPPSAPPQARQKGYRRCTIHLAKVGLLQSASSYLILIP